MTSEGNSALLHFQLQNLQLYRKSLVKDWSLGKQLMLFPSNFIVFLGSASVNKINCKVFPPDQLISVQYGPVILLRKYLPLTAIN